MKEYGFYHEERGYWQTLAKPSEDELSAYPAGTIEVPLKPGDDYVWMDNAWGYVAPEPEPELVPGEISRRQFFQQLAVMGIISNAEALSALQAGAIPAPLQIIIDQLPTDDDKFNAQMLVVGATTFNRLHPLSETVRIALSWTEQQKDDFWIAANKL